MDKIQTIAIGQFLANIHSDFEYFTDFKKALNGENNEGPTLLYNFLKAFKVNRGFRRDQMNGLWGVCKDYIGTDNPTPDVLAEEMKEFTNNSSRQFSAASKILFVCKPDTYFPVDSLSKKAVGLRRNDYDQYMTRLKIFLQNEANELKQLENSLNNCIGPDPNWFPDFTNRDEIIYNRLIDKYLWVKGMEKKKKKNERN